MKTEQEGTHGVTLEGAEVAITGRLACMTRALAGERLAAAGARLVERPTRATALLFLGEDGPPLGEDGRLTRALERALQLQAEGAPLEVANEARLLALLGLAPEETVGPRLYTTGQLSRILGVPHTRVRAWVRQGLLRPVKEVGRLAWFEFSQVKNARRLAELLAKGVQPAQIRASLRQITGWHAGDAHTALDQMELLDEPDAELVLRNDEGQVVESTGQLRLDFDADEEAPPAPRSPLRLVSPASDSRHWFERGLALEEDGDHAAAVEAYTRSIELGGPDAETFFNMGNALYADDLAPEAIAALELAVELAPDYVEAWNNLGIALSEIGHSERAVEAFTRALDLAPDYADAHFNLAEAHLQRGERSAARKHLLAYLKHDPASKWADEARAVLSRLEGTDRTPG